MNRPLSEHLVSMVLSYWRSSAELEDLFSTFIKGDMITLYSNPRNCCKMCLCYMLPDLQALALDSNTMETGFLERGL